MVERIHQQELAPVFRILNHVIYNVRRIKRLKVLEDLQAIPLLVGELLEKLHEFLSLGMQRNLRHVLFSKLFLISFSLCQRSRLILLFQRTFDEKLHMLLIHFQTVIAFHKPQSNHHGDR